MSPSVDTKRLSSLWVELPLAKTLCLLIFLSSHVCAQINSVPVNTAPNVYLIDGTGTAPGTFATIQAAFTALQNNGLDLAGQGAVLRVQNSWNPASEPSTIALSTYANPGPNRPVILTFADLTNPVTIASSPAGTAGNRFIFRFTGTFSYFTLDGAGKLILKSTNATGGTTTGLIGFVSTGTLDLDVDAIAVLGVVMHGHSRANTFAGVYIGQDATLTTGTISTGSSVGATRGVVIDGCTIDSVSRPIFVAGIRANTRNIQVTRDTLGNPTDASAWAAANNIGAVHLRGVLNPVIRGCVVHGQSSATNYNVAGIRLDTCENFTIERNWIYDIRYTGTGGWGSYGIFLNMPSSFIGTPSNLVANNMIAGISSDGYNPSPSGLFWVSGIYVSGSTSLTDNRLSLIHNSINLYGAYSGGSTHTGTSSGLTLAPSIVGGVTIHGNLIQNQFDAANNDTAQAVVILVPASSISTAGFNINHNQYYVGGSAHVVRFGRFDDAGVNTFAAWTALTALGSPDANGMMHLPGTVPFVSNTDLHLTPSSPSSAVNAGDNIYNGTQDFDGQLRPIGSPNDPGVNPDVGADEVGGTTFTCPSSLSAPDLVVTTTYPPLALPNYLWGQQAEIDINPVGPPPLGVINLIYSLDGGATWTAGPTVSSFPVTITLPPLNPPNYTGTLLVAAVATTPTICPPLTPDTSNIPASIPLTDRPGNRAATAIPVTLSGSGGIWTATVQDSTNGPGLSDEFGVAGGARYGSAARDFFFVLTLPECLDSLRLNTCSGNTNYDTRIHLINATASDTITNEDQGNPPCASAGFGNPQWTSQLVARGLPNTNSINLTVGGIGAPSRVDRDSMLLVTGHTYYIVVEGFVASSAGRFELSITGFKQRPSSVSITGAPTSPICINSAPVTLTATPAGATTYQWEVNGNVVSGANTATLTAAPNTEGTFNVVAKAIYNPNDVPACADTITSSPVTVTVEDTAKAKIADASNVVISGQTLNVTVGSNVALNVSSPQTSGNSYTWNRYNSIPSSGTPTTSTSNSLTITNIAAGDYTVILEAVRGTGVCGTTRDTVYIRATTTAALNLGMTGFAVYPNPNTGSFTISAVSAARYQVQVLDVAGRLVVTDAFEGMQHQMRVNLPAGVYQIRLVEGDNTYTGRLIITE